jgi:hypothetical protein
MLCSRLPLAHRRWTNVQKRGEDRLPRTHQEGTAGPKSEESEPRKVLTLSLRGRLRPKQTGGFSVDCICRQDYSQH